MKSKQEHILAIPASELQIDFVRASGAGGQNVNKVNTKAQLRWSVGASAGFSDQEKRKIKTSLANRINEKGEILLSSQETRSQAQNKQRIITRLHELVEKSLRPVAKRIPTKPTRASTHKRLESKRLTSKRKQARRKASDWLHQ